MSKKKFDIPTKEEQDRLFNFLGLSKMGARLHPGNMMFCELMYNMYPEWYSSIEKDVFNATKPFGANNENS
jgi:hypothetical protein